MRARIVDRLAAIVAVAVTAIAALTVAQTGDYGHDAAPAIEALTRGDIAAFAERPAFMGTFTIYLRAPLVALSDAFGGGQLWGYRVGALPCLLAVVGLGVFLARRARDAGQAQAVGLIALAIAVAVAVLSQSLRWGHPEELLGGVLVVAAVALAAGGRATLAGVALGLAIATKQWAVLAVLPALLAAPSGRVRLAVVAAAVAAAMILPTVLADHEAFVGTQKSAAHTSYLVLPANVWWVVASHDQIQVFDGVANRTMTTPHLSPTLQWVSHPLIVLLALPLSALALWRHRGRPLGHDALALLALLLLLRCALDPWNNFYYHVPFVLALLTFEVLGRRGMPILTVLACLVTWLTFDMAVTFDDAVRTGGYLAWAALTAGALAGPAFALGGAGTRRRVRRPLDRFARA